MKSVRDTDVHGKVVLLRCDFNVPLKDGQILDDNRIVSALPTIQFLLEKKAKIVIATHLGRPKMPQYEAGLSTVTLAQKLSQLLQRQVIASDFVMGAEIENIIETMKNGNILLIGNLRFAKGEEINDEGFAHELASLADIYVNDAFAVSHRANASIEAITKFVPSFAGLRLESEITSLSFLLDNPERPFLLIIGGQKLDDKAKLLSNLQEKADKILIGGAIANTFLAAKNEFLSRSLYDKELLPLCKEMLSEFGEKLLLPLDTIKEELGNGEFRIMDIGPQTVELFVHEINNSKCFFWNGNMGYTEDERFAKGTIALADALKNNPGTKVVAGGDTTRFVLDKGYKESISFISTGGAAAMRFLSGAEMPGVKALERNQEEN